MGPFDIYSGDCSFFSATGSAVSMFGYYCEVVPIRLKVSWKLLLEFLRGAAAETVAFC